MVDRPNAGVAAAFAAATITMFAASLISTPVSAQQPVLRFETRAAAVTTSPQAPQRWFKGNTHTHTINSDGDSPPDAVALWYKQHGYNFLVLTDHNVFTDPKMLAGLVDSTFMLIAGEELTTSFEQKPVHVNGLNIPHVLQAQKASTLLETIQKNVDEIRGVSGVPHINHPNFGWAISAATLAQVKNDKLLEIFNGHPTVHNAGGGDSPGMEEVWDILLTGGKRIYGIAVDDAHHFKEEFAAGRANPGRGWVGVRSARLDAADIMASMEAGDFYASTGVDLDDVVVTPSRLEVHIRKRGNFKYRTQFVGAGGRILAETTANPAVYTLAGNQAYVRARVTDSGGSHAWVQPVFTVRAAPATPLPRRRP